MLPDMTVALIVWLTVAAAAQAQDVANVQDAPEGPEGWYFILFREDTQTSTDAFREILNNLDMVSGKR